MTALIARAIIVRIRGAGRGRVYMGNLGMKKAIIGIAVVSFLAGLVFIQLDPSTDEEGVMEVAQEEISPPLDVPEPDIFEPPVAEPEVPLEALATTGAEPNVAGRMNQQAKDTSPLADIMSTLSEYFDAAFANDTVRAAAVAKPESAVVRQIDQLAQVEFSAEDVQFEVLADEAHGVAISERVAVEDGGGYREGYLLFFLFRNESGTWLIDDIDFETGESGSEELDAFVERYPEATYLVQFDK